MDDVAAFFADASEQSQSAVADAGLDETALSFINQAEGAINSLIEGSSFGQQFGLSSVEDVDSFFSGLADGSSDLVSQGISGIPAGGVSVSADLGTSESGAGALTLNVSSTGSNAFLDSVLPQTITLGA